MMQLYSQLGCLINKKNVNATPLIFSFLVL